jgi:hypothetical protein
MDNDTAHDKRKWNTKKEAALNKNSSKSLVLGDSGEAHQSRKWKALSIYPKCHLWLDLEAINCLEGPEELQINQSLCSLGI